MTTAYTSLLGLALPVTGELSGTWGDTVNNGITSLLDSAIAGTTTLSTDADVTLTTTTGAANTAREAILLWTAGGTATRTITVPAQSKIYTVINKTSSTQSIKVVGAGPTTGVTIIAGETAQIAWNGSDFVKIGELGGDVSFRNVTITGTTTLSGGTANGVMYLNGSKVVTTGSALVFDGTNLGLGVTPSAWISGATSLDVRSTSSFADVGGSTTIANNSYRNSGGGWIYKTTNYATRLETDTGAYRWYTAPSGTAGNAITFTHAMTLDASGNLGIGTTSPAAKLNVTSNATVSTSTYYSSTFSSLINAASSSGISALGLTSLNSGGFPATASFHVVPVAGYRSGLVATYAADSGGSGYFAINQYDPNASTTYERLRLDLNGNLGLGVTPSASWVSSQGPAFQVGLYTSVFNNGYLGAAEFAYNTVRNGNDTYVYGNTGVAASRLQQRDGQFKFFTATSGTAGNAITFTQAMTLDASGNLGIGTSSPNQKLTVLGGSLSLSSTTTSANTSVGAMLGYSDWNGSKFNIAKIDFQTQDAADAGQIIFSTSYGTLSERMRLDSSGNLGLGVTPSAWASNYTSIDLKGFGALVTVNSGAIAFILTANEYQNSGSKYKTTGFAARYDQRMDDGSHRWYTAPSGTAGNAITFTQAMTLDASGNLLVGTTSSTAYGDGIVIGPNLGVGAAISLGHASGTSSGAGYALFGYNGSNIGSITQSGTTAVLYNVTSDQRLKENIQDAADTALLIDSLQVRQFDWKADGSHQSYGFIAQELVTVAPEAVHQPADPEAMMAVDYSKLVPMLVKEIQSLRKRLAALEAK